MGDFTVMSIRSSFFSDSPASAFGAFISLGNRAKDISYYPLANACFVRALDVYQDVQHGGEKVPAKFSIESDDDSWSPDECYYDLAFIRLGGESLCIPVPLLEKSAAYNFAKMVVKPEEDIVHRRESRKGTNQERKTLLDEFVLLGLDPWGGFRWSCLRWIEPEDEKEWQYFVSLLPTFPVSPETGYSVLDYKGMEIHTNWIGVDNNQFLSRKGGYKVIENSLGIPLEELWGQRFISDPTRITFSNRVRPLTVIRNGDIVRASDDNDRENAAEIIIVS